MRLKEGLFTFSLEYFFLLKIFDVLLELTLFLLPLLLNLLLVSYLSFKFWNIGLFLVESPRILELQELGGYVAKLLLDLVALDLVGDEELLVDSARKLVRLTVGCWSSGSVDICRRRKSASMGQAESWAGVVLLRKDSRCVFFPCVFKSTILDLNVLVRPHFKL